jgi:plastocyanin
VRSAVIKIGIAAALTVLLAACGGKSSTEPSSGNTGSPGPSGATITLLAGGTLSPQSVSIAVGQSVTFVNNDSRVHDMTSDPHPSHTQCPPINAVGVLTPGQTRLTNALPTAMTCGFHDHGDPDNTNLQGMIAIK